MFARQITDKNILRVLTGGFSLVIVLLVVAGVIDISNLRSIRDSAASLVSEQGVSTALVDEIQREQENLNAIFYALGREPDLVDRDQILAQLDAADRQIGRIVKSASGNPEEPVWKALQTAGIAFSEEARHLISQRDAETLSSRNLMRRHEDVIGVVAKLIESSHLKSRMVQAQIEKQAHGLVMESSALLGAAVLLALLFAWLTCLHQESVARRFSHELHDELGQSLTAVKANLLSMKSTAEPKRMEDCLQLVNESIQNVREMSQLLRPTILDDFGLDACLRSLAEMFSQRTGTDVEYESNFSGRLADETETHLFRIAQEALTNVARHSGAKKVRMNLRFASDKLHLEINDNGCGIPAGDTAPAGGLGMIGMRARARSAGGEVLLKSGKSSGVSIEVWVPAKLRES